jgi:uncharacterized protein (DUF2345 family)
VIPCNRRGAPHADAEHLDPYRSALAQRADKRHTQGTADEMPGGADALLRLPGPAAISAAAARRTELTEGDLRASATAP